MKLRISTWLYILSVATIELAVGSRALRVDMGSFLATFYRNPMLMLFIPPTIALGLMLGGVNGIVSMVLLISPFAAFYFGKSINEETAKGLVKFFYALSALGFVQWVLGARIIGFLYSAGHDNKLPYSLLATEPSFGFEALFSLSLLLLAFVPGWRGYIPIGVTMLLSALTGVMTVWQNGLIFALAGLAALPKVSLTRWGIASIVLAPTVAIYAFPQTAKQLGLWVLYELGSWRQVSNAIAIGDAGWIEDRFFDYRSLVGDNLITAGEHQLAWWIESAFSWLPFVHSIVGKLPALLLVAMIFVMMPKLSNLTWRCRAIMIASLAIGFYTAPKWQFFSFMTVGAISQVAARRALCRQPTRTSLGFPRGN